MGVSLRKSANANCCGGGCWQIFTPTLESPSLPIAAAHSVALGLLRLIAPGSGICLVPERPVNLSLSAGQVQLAGHGHGLHRPPHFGRSAVLRRRLLLYLLDLALSSEAGFARAQALLVLALPKLVCLGCWPCSPITCWPASSTCCSTCTLGTAWPPPAEPPGAGVRLDGARRCPVGSLAVVTQATSLSRSGAFGLPDPAPQRGGAHPSTPCACSASFSSTAASTTGL